MKKQSGYTMADVLASIAIVMAGVTASVVGGQRAAQINGANAIVNEINYIHSATKESYYPLHNDSYAGLNETVATAEQLVPKSLQGGSALVNAYGGAVYINPAPPMNKSLVIAYGSLPKGVCEKVSSAFIRAGGQAAIQAGGTGGSMMGAGINWVSVSTVNWKDVVSTACKSNPTSDVGIKL